MELDQLMDKEMGADEARRLEGALDSVDVEVPGGVSAPQSTVEWQNADCS